MAGGSGANMQNTNGLPLKPTGRYHRKFSSQNCHFFVSNVAKWHGHCNKMKNKWILFGLLLVSTCIAGADDGSNLGLDGERLGATQSFEGIVTALGPIADDPDHTFTAISDEGLAKVFRISSLQDLDAGDRVSLQYVEGDVYPLSVTSIRFEDGSSGK
jgi:hypothetical protein